MKKHLALIMSVVVSTSMIVGCSSGQATSNNTEASGTTNSSGKGDGVLTIYSHYEGGPKAAADDYSEKTGVKVDWETIAYNDIPTKLNVVLGTDDEPDITLLDRKYVGTYIPQDEFINMDEVWGDKPELQAYKDNTYPATQDPGYYNGQLKAIGWECNPGAFFYRSDLASQYLGVNSPEDMEKLIPTEDDFIALQDTLDQDGSGLKLVGDFEFVKQAILSEEDVDPFVTDGTFTITKAFQDGLTDMKNIYDRGIYYTNNDQASLIQGAQDNAFLGLIAPAWYMQSNNIGQFQQPGQWAVCESPYIYAQPGTYIAVTKNADLDLAWDFISSTMINPDWLAENMDQFGFIGNTKAIDEYETNPDKKGNDYFGGEDTVAKFSEIASQISSSQPTTPYDGGIMSARDDAVNGYVFQGVYSTVADTCQGYSGGVKSLYPDLNVVIE